MNGEIVFSHAVGLCLGGVLVAIFLIAWTTGDHAWHIAWLAWFGVTTVGVAILSNRPRINQRRLDRAWAARIHERSIRDELTGLHNRRYFHDALEAAIAAAETGVPFTLLFVDLNGFKQINDDFGHGVGDQALIHAGRLLRAATPMDGHAARIGGDEFAIILPWHDRVAAEALSDRLDAAFVAAPPRHESRNVPLQVAAGAGQWRPGMTPAEVLRLAGGALYRRKAELGRVFERRAG